MEIFCYFVPYIDMPKIARDKGQPCLTSSLLTIFSTFQNIFLFTQYLDRELVNRSREDCHKVIMRSSILFLSDRIFYYI